MENPHLRVARPTDNLSAVVRFYRDGLGFDVIGHANLSYHLEFTHYRGHKVGKAPTQEHRLHP